MFDPATITNRGTRVAAAAAAMAVMFCGQPVRTQESQSVTIDVADCVDLDSEAARRDCFAAQVDAVLGQRSTPPQSAAESTVADDPGPDASPPSERYSEQEDEAEYFGTITALRERLPNAWVITLDNGQIWQQVQPEPYPLRPGLEVRVYPTNWGDSYRLIGAGTGRHIQVRRVR